MNKIILKNININDILHKNDNLLTIKELLIKINYDINNIYIDIFWDNIADDKWIYIDNELILWLDYKDINKGKEKIIKFLKSNFILEDDYKILSNVEYNNSTKNNYSFCSPAAGKQNINEEKRGAHNKQYIIISPDCFKELCMLVGTLKSKEIKKYYIELEKIFKFYLQYQAKYQELQNKQIQEKLENKDDELKENLMNDKFKINALIQSLDMQPVVYYGLISKDEIKFGHSNNIKQRIKDHEKIYNSFKIIYIKECNNNKLIESKIKQYARDNEILISKIINDKNYTELIKITNDITIDILIKKLEFECINLSKNNDKLVDILKNENIELNNKIEQLNKENKLLSEELDIIKKNNIENSTHPMKEEKKHKCHKCTYSTDNKFDLNEHLNRLYKCDEIRQKKKYICPKCNKEFNKPAKLEKHINKKTSCDKILQCVKCNKIFNIMHNYNQHINRKIACV
jgi:uncharacterized C2H2 Zn-finger protein